MGKVIMSGIVPQLTVPSAGTPISEFAVGSTVKMNVNGASKDFLIVHQGLPSSMYDSSCNGTWLLMKDIYETRIWNSSAPNAYQSSAIHLYLNGTFLGLFDPDVQSIINQVKIPYCSGYSGYSVYSGSSGLSAKIFLLGGYELGWTKDSWSTYLPSDGSCLSYFSGLSTTDSKRIAYLDGTATAWWTRSPYSYPYYDDKVCTVLTGGAVNYIECYSTYGIRPALILPSTALVKDDGTVKGAA